CAMAGAAHAAITDNAASLGRKENCFCIAVSKSCGQCPDFLFPMSGDRRDCCHGWLPFFIIQRNPA
ncbi:hypothetical protein ABTD62_19520, partial [Acinetobacter baumannii]